jgi:hypothetical protein
MLQVSWRQSVDCKTLQGPALELLVCVTCQLFPGIRLHLNYNHSAELAPGP